MTHLTKYYFGVKLKFDKSKIDNLIEETIKSNRKGYVCSIDGNIIANANSNPNYLRIINNALVNICDGSSIAFLTSIIHRKRYRTYIGSDLFLDYIRKKKYKQYFLGNTSEVLRGVKANLKIIDPKISDMNFKSLPFLDVNDFNYTEIARDINKNRPDIIWVSLGAPKQEEFMYRLLPFINKGVMFGFGAIFNFNSGIPKHKRAPNAFLILKIEWLFRLIKFPRKQFSKIMKIIKIYPRMICDEVRKQKNNDI